MKKAIFTIAVGEHFQRMGELTHPTIQAYADRIGADFIVWTDTSGYTIPEYKKMEVRSLLDTYDRVLYVDTDIIIRDDAPDIFDVVPEDHLGMFEESEHFDRRATTLRFMEHIGFDSTKWNGKYYNAGLFVCSRCHREMFMRPPVEWDDFRDQTFFNTIIADRGIKVFSLPHRFNRLIGLDPVLGESRLDSYFLHYAGVWTMLSPPEVLNLIKSDLTVWRRTTPRYGFYEHLAIAVRGGLGEQIAAEPTVRYARNVMCREFKMAVVTDCPQAFRHLNVPTYDAWDNVPNLSAYHRRYTARDPNVPVKFRLSQHQVQGAVLAGLQALGVELPAAYRRPVLAVDPAAMASVARKARPTALGELVLLHPGRAAAANTFPPDAWQAYADALVQHGFQVAVIGKHVDPRRGVVDFDRSACIDLVDQLSLDELVALISQARVLLSNDSGPVQIAGAFDRWIGLIATLRHPEYVLPWRHNSQFWRAESLERLPLYRDYVHKPSGTRQPSLEACDPERLRACLPSAERVVQFVQRALADDKA
jgi:hypothetical protein